MTTEMQSKAEPGSSGWFYSAVIPVFNSVGVVGETIDACVAFFESEDLPYEIVAVDDGSTDGSWGVVSGRAMENERIVAVRLLRNYGQHSALHCGLSMSRGDYVVTLDDDLQNRPTEIRHLIAKAAEGSDLVFGQFRHKMHSPIRRLGSWVTNQLNTRVFDKPVGLRLSNFKIIHRSVVLRILAHRTQFPYINGLAILYAKNPTDVVVEHHPRRTGASNYSIAKILELLARILFNYSAFPLRILASSGMVVALLSFLYSGYVLVKAAVGGTSVPGWASVAILVTFLNGMSLMVMGVIGEYVIRILKQTSMTEPYHVTEVVSKRDG